MREVLMALEIIVSIVLIIAVMLQPGRDAGLSAVTGQSSQVVSQGEKGKEGLLKNVTRISAILFMVLALILAAI